MTLLLASESRKIRRLRKSLETNRLRLAEIEKTLDEIRTLQPSVSVRRCSLEEVGIEPSGLCLTYRQLTGERAVLLLTISSQEDELSLLDEQ